MKGAAREIPTRGSHRGHHLLFGAGPPAWSQSPPDIQLTAAAATIHYFPFEAAFAIGSGIVGGLAYVFSGFCETTAKSIWIPSMYGTYIITPEHLSLDRPIRFLGVAAEIE